MRPARTAAPVEHVPPSYLERPSKISGSVLWRRLTAAEEVRVDPDGCMDLIWGDDRSLLVAGPDTGPHVYRGESGRTLIGVRFGSGIGPAVFGVPAHDLVDRRVPLEELWPADEVERLTVDISSSPTPGLALDRAAARRLERSGGPDPVIAEIVRLVRLGRGIREIAAAIGLSERQLHRRSLEAFGYGSKTLGRIVRLQAAVRLARMGASLVDSAVAAGYADQAHLAREAKSLTGVPPSALVRPAQPPVARGAKRSTELPSGSWTVA